MKKEKIIKIFMFLLFILTISSFFAGFLLWVEMSERPENAGGILFASTTYVWWLFLPIPILSIILGYRYKKLGIKCTKNIVAGYIMGVFLILNGAFCLINFSDSKDYSEVNQYKEIIDAPIPSNGRLDLIKWDYSSDNNITNHKTIYINYFKEDTEKLEESIKQKETWVLSTKMDKKLRFLVPTYIIGENIFIFIYNKTLNEYNVLPENSGNYKIYTMMYDASKKLLQIDDFNYLFK